MPLVMDGKLEAKESGQGDRGSNLPSLDSDDLKQHSSDDGSLEGPYPFLPLCKSTPKIENTSNNADEVDSTTTLPLNTHPLSQAKPLMMYAEVSRLTQNYRIQRKARNFLRGALEGFIIDLLTSVEQDKVSKTNRRRTKVDGKNVKETISRDHELSNLFDYDEIRRKVFLNSK